MGTQKIKTGDNRRAVTGYMQAICRHDLRSVCCLPYLSEGPHTKCHHYSRPCWHFILESPVDISDTARLHVLSSCRCGQATSAQVQDLAHVKLTAEGPLRWCWGSAMFLGFLLAVCGGSLHCLRI